MPLTYKDNHLLQVLTPLSDVDFKEDLFIIHDRMTQPFRDAHHFPRGPPSGPPPDQLDPYRPYNAPPRDYGRDQYDPPPGPFRENPPEQYYHEGGWDRGGAGGGGGSYGRPGSFPPRPYDDHQRPFDDGPRREGRGPGGPPPRRRVPCRFYGTVTGCRNGDSCTFLHE
jgi:hypothetical protein